MDDSGDRIWQRYFHELSLLELPTEESERADFKAYSAAKAQYKKALRTKKAAAKKEASEKTRVGKSVQHAKGLAAAAEMAKWKAEMAKWEQTLPKGYLRFVIREATKWVRNKPHNHVIFKELIAAGNLGLLTAIRKYRWKTGNRFLTYAQWWVRVHMQETLQREGTVHVPNHVAKARRRVKALEEKQIAQGVLSHSSIVEVCVSSLDESLRAPDDVEEAAVERQCDLLEYMEDAGMERLDRMVLIYSSGLRGAPALSVEEIATLFYGMDGSCLSPERIKSVRTRAMSRLGDELRSRGIERVADLV
jgi:RNA polymerase sigma factor (sigma-70 family)